MKTFTIMTALILGVVLSASAQEKTYIPNARQAVQKSRMQQPQYMELTKATNVNEAPQQGTESADSRLAATRSTNYQLERPLAIDAPKRRGEKTASSFSKLASTGQK